ncbi:MAG: hypothetical protein FJZ95_11080 [Chloroflexi bacterium]|nr:hypothetical protein [Chloroflexota bacterium]
MLSNPESEFKLPPVYQLGYVVRDIEKVCKYYESTFGIGPFSPPMDVNMDGAILRGRPVKTRIKVAFANSGNLQVELIQPVEGENPYFEFLAAKGDGIHHLAFQVDDMNKAKSAFAKKGFQPIFYHDMGVMEFAYFDTSEPGGLWVEFLHWKKK